MPDLDWTLSVPLRRSWAEVCRWITSLAGGSSCRGNFGWLDVAPSIQLSLRLKRHLKLCATAIRVVITILSVSARRSVELDDDKVVSEYEEDWPEGGIGSAIRVRAKLTAGVFEKVNDPGGGGGAAVLKAPPYYLANCCINHHYIIHAHFTRCLTHVPVGIFKKFAILKIYSDFKRKSISAGNEAWDDYWISKVQSRSQLWSWYWSKRCLWYECDQVGSYFIWIFYLFSSIDIFFKYASYAFN